MKSVVHSVYRGGSAGLSNLIMSVELGVVLARLTDRLLVLKGNHTPVANVVAYEGLVRNNHPSRVTDLIDLGVPWIDGEAMSLDALAPHEICNGPAWDFVFYYPAHLSLEGNDIKAFAGRRRRFITIEDSLQNVPALSFSGGLDAKTLSFFSYFFYLDQAAQLQALDALRGMRPKAELAAFAKRVASDLGAFNAAHIRRGDFKVTRGVTTLDRTPAEALAALDNHFDRDARLVILTDEANDPYFDEIRLAYRDHIFLDHHILQEYYADFIELPAHDSIALAYLSQLIAANASDFIGTMTSTFTALIQRMRGSAGKEELFKFLWNELPAPGEELERGRHKHSDCIRLDKGVMVPEFDGPYSWNRYNQRLNPAWMREWPEGFLDEAAMIERAQGRQLGQSLQTPAPSSANPDEHGERKEVSIGFLDANVTAGSTCAGTTKLIADLFAEMISSSNTPPIGEVRIETREDRSKLVVNGQQVDEDRHGASLLRALHREVVCLFIDGYPDLIWLHSGCASSEGGAAVLPGTWGRGKSSLVVALCERGWSFLSDDITPLDPAAGTALPFAATPRVRNNIGQWVPRSEVGNIPKTVVPLDSLALSQGPQPISMIVFPHYSDGASATLTPISPGQAVGELLEHCLSLAKNEDATINRLCRAVETLPVYRLRFANAAEAAELLIDAQEAMTGSANETKLSSGSEGDGMNNSDGVANVDVEVALQDGSRYASVLPADSPILHDLYASLPLRQRQGEQEPAILIQLPIDGGRAACSFMSDLLVSVTTRPPVLVQPRSGSHTYSSEIFAATRQSFILIDEFLTPDENEQLLEYALSQEAHYESSKVTTDREDYRKSKVLFAIKDSKWREIFMARLKLHLPHITDTLNTRDFRIGESEIQLTASNDGEYFKPHADAGNEGTATAAREITFVYYLHRTPRPYSGGDLLFYDGQPGQPGYDKGSGVTAVPPQNNRLIVFASNRWHEVDMVRCPTGEFADSRFTVNGWLRRAAAS